MSKIKDLTGNEYERLTVIKKSDLKKHNRVAWVCVCECGTSVVVAGTDLQTGNTKSCGCLRKEMMTTHGQSQSPLYACWKHMLQRCYNKTCESFENYGGRGIKVCEEWKDYEAFANWAKENNYSEELTLDRINVDENYEPGNCRWTDMKVQGNNRRNNKLLEYDGQVKTISEWARDLGMKDSTLRNRISRGWTIEKAIETPVR